MRLSFWFDLGSCLLIQAGCLILFRGIALLETFTPALPPVPPGPASVSVSPLDVDRPFA